MSKPPLERVRRPESPQCGPFKSEWPCRTRWKRCPAPNDLVAWQGAVHVSLVPQAVRLKILPDYDHAHA
eukprot:2423100-Alexandrium_andersonii.AAC.1